jgi:uncharacterized protein with beta-barrel porin domain
MVRRAAILALVGASVVGAASARAADFTVDDSGDTGAGTLREAISDANASADPSDTINFALSTVSTITLASDLEAVTSPTLTFSDTINAVTIDANDAILFQNASTAHNFMFSNLVTYRDGKIVFTEADTGTIGGTLKGNDVQLSKAGVGTTTLNGTITLDSASSVDITAGTFAVLGTLSAPGTLTVDAPATLVIGSVGSVTAGTVTDDGKIDVNAGGTLNATSSMVVASGASLVDGGTVNVTGSLTNSGTLTDDGTLSVTGALTNHGSLFANGAITAGSLVVASDGVLSGNGGTVTAPVTVAGRVSPSTPAGQLTINGATRFQSTSTFEAEIGPGGSGDALGVTGAVTIDPGARLSLVADPDQITGTSMKTVLTATGGISGQFVSTDYAFFQEDLNYQPNSLTVTLTSTGQNFTQFANTPNQRAVASVLDTALPGATGSDLASVFDALKTAKANEIGPLLDAIGGESLTAFATARQILAERTARALHRRARDASFGQPRAFYLPPSDTPDVAAGGEDEPEPETPAPERAPVRAGAWVDGLGLFGELDGDDGEADLDTLLYGATLGGDAWLGEHFVVGLAAGYARSDVDLSHRDTDVYGDTIQGALYAGFVDPRGYLSAYGRYAHTFETSTRQIQSSTLDRDAHADFDAQDYGLGGEAGLTLVSYRGFALQPIVGIDWLHMTEENYTESGAGDLNLIVDPDDLDTTTARFGARASAIFDMGKAGRLAPELRAFYQHLYGDRDRTLDARLTGAPGLGSIGVRGAEIPRDSFLLGAGWGVLVGEHLTVSFDYDAVLGHQRAEHQGTIAARVAF